MKFRFLVEIEINGFVISFPKFQKQVTQQFTPVAARAPTVEDFPANQKLVKCEQCHHQIRKLEGYKNFYGRGFLCAVCQDAKGYPLRS